MTINRSLAALQHLPTIQFAARILDNFPASYDCLDTPESDCFKALPRAYDWEPDEVAWYQIEAWIARHEGSNCWNELHKHASRAMNIAEFGGHAAFLKYPPVPYGMVVEINVTWWRPLVDPTGNCLEMPDPFPFASPFQRIWFSHQMDPEDADCEAIQ